MKKTGVEFSYYFGCMEDFIAVSLSTKGVLIKRILATVSQRLIDDLHQLGVAIDSSWKHTIDNSAVRHAIKVHGESTEELRGQVKITAADLIGIPEIIAGYDSVRVEINKRSQYVLIYSKSMADGTVIYVEEVRNGRKELATSTIYKRKKENSPTQID
ncbi:MAG: hypothetical protein J5632_02640 [Bacteroidales bacterium]|nr:hypothetical protein [Bacteroidales bacterium]